MLGISEQPKPDRLEVRFAFTKGNNLGTSGCVSYMFNRKGVLLVLVTPLTKTAS